MALANMGFKDQNWSHLWDDETVERERGESKRREEEEEEEDGEAKQAKVWNFGFLYGTNLGYEFYYGSHGFSMEF